PAPGRATPSATLAAPRARRREAAPPRCRDQGAWRRAAAPRTPTRGAAALHHGDRARGDDAPRRRPRRDGPETPAAPPAARPDRPAGVHSRARSRPPRT